MVELLIIMEVETKDALLQAINAEFVEAVELLLEHEELIHKDGEPYVSICNGTRPLTVNQMTNGRADTTRQD